MVVVFQAMNKGFVTESRGIRLLEAQIATGGLIDPRVSTRVPLTVAYRRGIFNEKMFAILTDPSDDTKVNTALVPFRCDGNQAKI